MKGNAETEWKMLATKVTFFSDFFCGLESRDFWAEDLTKRGERGSIDWIVRTWNEEHS
jgi:hypothetical protein